MEIADIKAVAHEKDSSQSVRVAVNIRPLITPELLIGCTDCITVLPGEPQVQLGSHAFTYDYVYGSGGLPYAKIYKDCVDPLIDSLFHGYNATVLAYGQTGSGKTFTMGTNYTGNGSDTGIIPQVMESIFSRVAKMEDSSEFLIRVSFIEIFKEEVFDLLDPSSTTQGVSHVKAAAPARVPIQIRETVNGGITLAGVTEAEVRTKEEMASYLSCGSLSRATASTNMNSQSSRSHAIFTISMEQKRVTQRQAGVTNDDAGDDILSAKLHLVDLAGSERAKRTGADGMRFKEGIHINKGLLALGNVISALGDEKKRKEGGHVPYRDSKLTRLLQDSLGGNSKTVMIACVSPADSNAEETLNTLKYANRARNIQNKAVINRDPMAAQMQRMRSQIEQLQAELLFFRGDASAPFEEVQILKQKNSLLEAKNSELQREVKERHITCEHLSQRAIDAQVEKDKLVMKLESVRNGKSLDEIDSAVNQDLDLVKRYVTKIQELEGELLSFQNLSCSKGSGSHDTLDSDDDGFHIKKAESGISEDFPYYDAKTMDISDSGDTEVDEKELEHSSLQENLDRELKELDQKLEQKEAEMKQFTSGNTSILKQHYEKKVLELEHEKRSLQKEIDELRHNLAHISTASDDGAQRLKQDYLQKLNLLEAQVSELKKKQDAQSQLLRQKQKSDEAAKRLQDEIHRIKSQKVQLQHKIKQESEQFRLWKASREKEVLQLKKEGRRNEYEMHKLLALNQRQKMVLQRKTEEAAMAAKRLKDLLESKKAFSGAGKGNGPGIQALMQAIEHELEVTVRVHEVRSEYEHQMEERARMAKEVAKLKEEAAIMKQKNLSCPETMSPGARNSRIFALENMLATSSSTLVSMASQLSEAEERERLFGGRGRWNQVRTIAEAKNVMNYLFNLASSSRCQLRDKEVDCREKDTLVRELKEKVVKLSCLVRQFEMQKQEYYQETSLVRNGNSKEYAYDLRKERSSIICSGRNELQEDMDTSDSEHSDEDWVASETEMESEMQPTKKRFSRTGARPSTHEINSNASILKTGHPGDGHLTETSIAALCCTCSKSSSCKTMKCQCRAAAGICGVSCGCVLTKCSNRSLTMVKEEPGGLDQRDSSEGSGTSSGMDEADRSHSLASHGAVLLQGAFDEKPNEPSDDCGPRRRPLSDIGNTAVKSNAPKPIKRKKWKKSVIQLVPVAPPPPQPETTEPPTKLADNSTAEADIPLKLPRAMRSMTSNGNPLNERNSDQSSKSVLNKEADASPPRTRTLDEKENHRH